MIHMKNKKRGTVLYPGLPHKILRILIMILTANTQLTYMMDRRDYISGVP